MVPLSSFASRSRDSNVSSMTTTTTQQPPYPLFPSSFAPPATTTEKLQRSQIHGVDSNPGIGKRFLKWFSRKISSSVATSTAAADRRCDDYAFDSCRATASVRGVGLNHPRLHGADIDEDEGADESRSELAPITPASALRSSSRRRTRGGSFTSQYPVLKGMYSVRETIGTGGFAKVKRAVHLLTGEKCAIKIMDKKSLGDDLPRVYLEMEALKSLVHQNICKLFQVIETEEQIFAVMEFCTNGELFDYIVSRDKLNESEARGFFRQIVSALGFMHRNGFVHRDLKPENLLLDKNHKLKLIDFGLCAKWSGREVNMKTCCGSPAYAAPELIMGKEYHGPEADVWSLGILLFAILCGYLPFDDDNITNLYKKIQTGRYSVPEWLSPQCIDLISNLLQVDPAKRLSMEALLVHPWITKNYTISVNWESNCPKNDVDLDCAAELAFHCGRTRKEVTTKLKNWKYDYLTATYMLLLQKKQSGKTARLLPSAQVALHEIPAARLRRLPTVPFSSSSSSASVQRLYVGGAFDPSRPRHSSYVHRDVALVGHLTPALPVTLSSGSESSSTLFRGQDSSSQATSSSSSPNGTSLLSISSSINSSKTLAASDKPLLASNQDSIQQAPKASNQLHRSAANQQASKSSNHLLQSDAKQDSIQQASRTSNHLLQLDSNSNESQCDQLKVNSAFEKADALTATENAELSCNNTAPAAELTAASKCCSGASATSATLSTRTFRAGVLRVGKIKFADEDDDRF